MKKVVTLPSIKGISKPVISINITSLSDQEIISQNYQQPPEALFFLGAVVIAGMAGAF
jgi:hypothetical protein